VRRISPISQTIGTANADELAKLALNNARAEVLRLTRVRQDEYDRRPLAYEKIALTLSHFPALARDGDVAPDILELAQRHGVSLGLATERVSIVRATSHVALHLGVAAGTNVLKLDRIIETASGEPIGWRVTNPPFKYISVTDQAA
jgi:DNA-binding GntR family transcriptional regulator